MRKNIRAVRVFQRFGSGDAGTDDKALRTYGIIKYNVQKEKIIMCMMLYIGSDNELPLIEWQKGVLFAVGEIDGNDAVVKRHFKTKYHYVLGSHIGCGCGFFEDEAEAPGTEPKVDKTGRDSSIKALVDCIGKHVSGDYCELVSCWTGSEGGALDYSEEVKLGESELKNALSEFYQKRMENFGALQHTLQYIRLIK